MVFSKWVTNLVVLGIWWSVGSLRKWQDISSYLLSVTEGTLMRVPLSDQWLLVRQGCRLLALGTTQSRQCTQENFGGKRERVYLTQTLSFSSTYDKM